MTDVDSLIAEGLTRALTGLNAPYAQLQESKDTLDLTWTHGAHPFYPFGYLPPEAKPDTHHGVLAAASRRTILASRCHRYYRRYALTHPCCTSLNRHICYHTTL